jgi:hypothetical protein
MKNVYARQTKRRVSRRETRSLSRPRHRTRRLLRFLGLVPALARGVDSPRTKANSFEARALTQKAQPKNRKPALPGGFPAERLFTIPEQQPSSSKAMSHSSAASPWEATGMVCRFACERDDDVHDSTISASRRRFGVLEHLSAYAVPAAPKGSARDQGHCR